MTPGLRDILLLLAATAAAIVVGAVAQRFIEPRWQVMLGVGALFAAAAAVKLMRPTHSILGGVSWIYIALVFAISETALWLLADWTIVGAYWTIPAVVCLGLLYCVVHLALGPKRG